MSVVQDIRTAVLYTKGSQSFTRSFSEVFSMKIMLKQKWFVQTQTIAAEFKRKKIFCRFITSIAGSVIVIAKDDSLIQYLLQ